MSFAPGGLPDINARIAVHPDINEPGDLGTGTVTREGRLRVQ